MDLGAMGRFLEKIFREMIDLNLPFRANDQCVFDNAFEFASTSRVIIGH